MDIERRIECDVCETSYCTTCYHEAVMENVFALPCECDRPLNPAKYELILDQLVTREQKRVTCHGEYKKYIRQYTAAYCKETYTWELADLCRKRSILQHNDRALREFAALECVTEYCRRIDQLGIATLFGDDELCPSRLFTALDKLDSAVFPVSVTLHFRNTLSAGSSTSGILRSLEENWELTKTNYDHLVKLIQLHPVVWEHVVDVRKRRKNTLTEDARKIMRCPAIARHSAVGGTSAQCLGVVCELDSGEWVCTMCASHICQTCWVPMDRRSSPHAFEADVDASVDVDTGDAATPHAASPATSPTTTHVCSPDDVETTKMLRDSTKACPTCFRRIEKAAGCFHMACHFCHTHFDWTTGDVLPGYGRGTAEHTNTDIVVQGVRPSSWGSRTPVRHFLGKLGTFIQDMRDRVAQAMDLRKPFTAWRTKTVFMSHTGFHEEGKDDIARRLLFRDMCHEMDVVLSDFYTTMANFELEGAFAVPEIWMMLQDQIPSVEKALQATGVWYKVFPPLAALTDDTNAYFRTWEPYTNDGINERLGRAETVRMDLADLLGLLLS